MAQGTLLSALWWPKWEGNPKKEGMYVHVWLIHFAVQQKLIQHCKAIFLQLKNIKNTILLKKKNTQSQISKEFELKPK